MARVLAGAILLMNAVLAPPVPAATEQELADARERRQQLQERLDETVAAFDAAQTRLATTQASMEQSRAELDELEEVSERVQRRVAERASEVYRQGPVSMFQFLIGAESFSDLGRRLKLLQEAAEQDAAILQEAEITRERVARLQADLAAQEAQEQQILRSMAEQTEALRADFAEARDLEAELATDRAEAQRFAEQRAAEEAAARRTEQQRAAAEAEEQRQAEQDAAQPEPAASPSLSPEASPSLSPEASPSPGSQSTPESAGAAGQPSSGLYCPVDGPVSFTDTYGHPRSGGRTHLGVDMFAAMGTPVAAITDGTITRRSSSTLGGLYIYFTGTDGTEYFYTHLSGYTDIPVGRQIDGGTHVGYVGNSGNARGTPPHVHFEVAPEGRGNINPTPIARRACGR